MKRNFLWLLLLCLNACAVSDTENNESTQYEEVDNNKDYFLYKVQPEYAQHFEVSYQGNYKIVKTDATFYPDGKQKDGKSRQDVVVLVQKGTQPPPLTGELQDAQVIHIPVETVAVNIENAECFLAELGLQDRIVAVGGAISYNDTIRQKVLHKQIGQVGYSWHQPSNLEVLLQRKPEVFFMNIANLDFAGSLEKTRKIGIPTAPIVEWAEADYLALAEWIKFFSVFFNAEQKANEVFNGIQNRVDSLKKLVATVPNKPTAIWGYYTGKDRWLVHCNNNEAQFMKDAGLINVFEDFSRPLRNSGEPISSEELLARGRNAEHWIIGDIHSAALPSANYMNTFQSWRTGKLYHNMKRSKPKANAFDWYGTAIVRPDIVLADLIKLIHPELLPAHELFFMDHFDKSTKLPLEINDVLYN